MKLTYLMGACLVLAALGGCGAQMSRPESNAGRKAAAETQVTLGVGYMQKGRMELALERFERALKFDPQSALAHTSIGVLYEQIGNAELAEKSYRRAAALTPKKGGVRNNLGQFLCRSGEFEEADKEFQLALADPFYSTPEAAAANAGKCARAAGNLPGAERYLREALRRKPNFIEAFLPMAELLAARGEHLNARAYIQRYESAQLPQTAEFLGLAVQVEEKLGDRMNAQSYRERLLTTYPDSAQAKLHKERPL